MQCAAMKNEIVRKSLALGRIEVNSVKNAHYYEK